MAKLKCPRCRSAHVTLLDNAANIKKTQTSLNLNPLKPFTVFDHKPVKKKSGAKVAAAILTGGSSLLVTGGLNDNRKLEIFCQDCGHRWKRNKKTAPVL